MADDGLVLALRRLETEPTIRPAFTASLRDELHGELGFGASAGAASPGSFRPSLVARLIRSLRPMTPRVAILVALALLLLAGTVAAAYLALTTWLSTGPRGAQYSNDFAFAELYRGPGAYYTGLRLAPDGHSILAIRQSLTWPPAADAPDPPAIVRFDLTSGERLAPTVVLPLSRLGDPSLWDPGTQLSGRVIVPAMNAGFDDELSIAGDGDLFVGVSAWPAGQDQGQTGASSLVVVHPDGSAQKVVTLGELFAAGLLGKHSTTGSLAGTASAPDRLWVRAEAPAESGANGSAWWLFEVVDPTPDGDWSDRIIRPLVLPASMPRPDDTTWQWRYGDFVAEPSLGEMDRSRSVLLSMVSRDDELRVYRISDPNDDGNATDPGETELVFSGRGGPGAQFTLKAPRVAPRVVTDGGRVALDELVVGDLSRPGRLSRITGTGDVVDIARALGWSLDGLIAAPDGAIYVATQEPGDATKPSTFLIDRLTPVPVGSEQSTAPPSATAPGVADVAVASPLVSLGAVTPGVARIAVEVDDASSGSRSEILSLGADGSGPAELLPGDHNAGFCQSADGSRIDFWSDEAVPNEFDLYSAKADGTDREKVSEQSNVFWCASPEDAVLLLVGSGSARMIVRHDLATGRETPLTADAVVPLASSADGGRLAVASGADAGTLEEIDVETGAQRAIVGPIATSIRSAAWSPNGDRIAYVAGPPEGPDPSSSGDYATYMTDIAGGAPKLLARSLGRLPTVAWSADGRRVLILSKTHDTRDAESAGSLQLVDVASGAVETVGGDDVVYAGWSPAEPGTLAYATPAALYVMAAGAQARALTPVPIGALCPTCPNGPVSRWPGGEWMGWSPDGRYIGLGDFSAVIAVVDVSTGELRSLMTETPTTMLVSPRWWR